MSRKAGLLLLSEDDYAAYVHQKGEFMRMQTSNEAEAMQTARREMNSRQEGEEDVIHREMEAKWGGLLKKLGLEEVQSPSLRSELAPASVSNPRIFTEKDLQKSIERLTSKPAFSSIPSPRNLVSPKATPAIADTAPVSCPSPPIVSLDELLAESFERQKTSRFSDLRVLPTKQTLAKYLSEVKSAETALNSSAGISQKSTSLASPRSAKASSTLPTKRKALALKRKLKRKADQHLTTTTSLSQSPRGLEQSERPGPKPLTHEQKREKVMEEIRSMAALKEKEGEGLGELMRMGFRTQPDRALSKLNATELAAMKHLNSRAYAMLSNNPSLLYSIICDPEHAVGTT
jgi:hypothetical protein